MDWTLFGAALACAGCFGMALGFLAWLCGASESVAAKETERHHREMARLELLARHMERLRSRDRRRG